MAQMDWSGGGNGFADAYNPAGHKLQDAIREGFDKQGNDIADHDERLKALEARLYILHANVEMEKLYPELKEAYTRYKEIEEKITTFHTLKTSK